MKKPRIDCDGFVQYHSSVCLVKNQITGAMWLYVVVALIVSKSVLPVGAAVGKGRGRGWGQSLICGKESAQKGGNGDTGATM